MRISSKRFLKSVCLLFFRKNQKMGRQENKMRVALLGKTEVVRNEFFCYKPIKLHTLGSKSFQEKDYQDYSALFICSEHFSAVARTDYRIYLQELAQKIPIVFVGAQSLLYSDFDYEERNMEPRTQSYLQVLFYFSNGEDCLFRTDGFAYEEQRELAQAIRLLQEATSYTEWERAFYEY